MGKKDEVCMVVMLENNGGPLPEEGPAHFFALSTLKTKV